jgi:hypothetical protein
LTTATLGESLERAGMKMLVLSAGSSGSALLDNHPLHGGAVVNPDLIEPDGIKASMLSALGPGPAEAVPNNARNKWAVDAYLLVGLKAVKAEVTVIWFGDPDATAHATGIGSEATKQALGFVDAEIGRIEEVLKTAGLLERTNILVTSDHGFSTQTGELKLAALVAPFAKPMPDGSTDLLVTEGAINFRGPKDPVRVAALVTELQRHPEVGAIFTRPAADGSLQGLVSGTLSFNVARWNHARAGEVLVSGNWSHEKNAAGVAGKTTQGGVAGHGTSSPYDIHNTLIAVGPAFREHATSMVPTANVDLAPTLLKLLGVAIPPAMTGRVIKEALRSGPAPAHGPRRTPRRDCQDGRWCLPGSCASVDGRRLSLSRLHGGAAIEAVQMHRMQLPGRLTTRHCTGALAETKTGSVVESSLLLPQTLRHGAPDQRRRVASTRCSSISSSHQRAGGAGVAGLRIRDRRPPGRAPPPPRTDADGSPWMHSPRLSMGAGAQSQFEQPGRQRQAIVRSPMVA